jgi:endoglucanase
LGTGVLLAVTVQSAAIAAPTRYEAENAPAVCNGTIDSNWAGFSGAGFCNATNAIGSSVQFTVNAANAGTATLGIRYANGTTADRPADISVNGTVVAAASSFAPTGAWTTWVTKTLTATVNAGSNTVTIAGTTANGPANIDFLDFEVAPPATFTDYQAENCTISQGVVESNHLGFTGTGFVNYDNLVGSYVECAVAASTAGSATLTFRHSNGTTTNRPMSISVNGTVVNSNLAFNPTANWDTWADVPLTVSLNAGTNVVRAISTTVNGGPNLDRIRASVAGPPDTTPPSVPLNPRVTSTTCSSISLAWDPSTDNVGVTGYKVYEGTTVKATPSSTTATVSGLAASTSHTFTITAVDAAGNESGASAPVTGTTGTSCSTRPVDINGQLHVCGVNLCNQYNKPIQLRGMSTHGLQWYYNCLNTASLDALASDWQADIIRISMYVQEGGYETNPQLFTDRVNTLIEAATARGIYAIVDWHMLEPGDPFYNLDRAKTFFTAIASRHKDKVNILYEVANEPSGVSWSRIKSYHEQIIPVIRAQDPDGIVLAGTRAWSSLGVSDGADETEVINNPVNATNIMYTFHFYAASHGSEYLNALSRAANSIPMFVTEYGTQTYTGDGGNNFTMSQQYLDLMAQKKISWTNWNYSDDFRSGAVFTTGTCPGGPFTGTTRLKAAGVWVRDHIRNPPDNFPTS